MNLIRLSDHFRKSGQFIALFTIDTMILTILLLCYMPDSNIVQSMDFMGWIYYISSCFSHAAIIAAGIFIVFYGVPALFHKYRLATILTTIIVSILSALILLNLQVFRIYHFHINGLILNMVFGSGAGEIFTFDTMVYVKEIISLLFIFAIITAGAFLSYRFQKIKFKIIFFLILGTLLLANGIHVYGAFYQKTSVIKSTRLIPYYFPLSATRMLESIGCKAPATVSFNNNESGDIRYPVNKIRVKDSKRPNIIMILIDSWNKRSLTKECMPNIWQYANESEWYQNHFSSSNGTRFSMFGLYFGVPSYYWDNFESSHKSPVLINELLAQGYDIKIHTSATLKSPPFYRILFQRVPHLQIDTPGKTVYDRDAEITKEMIHDINNRKKGKPFYGLLFYDLAHSFQIPEDKLKKFQPSWKYADYEALSNDMDPTPFWNLYRNCCYQIDGFVAKVLKTLKEKGMDKNTIVIISGDHAQEFNENHKNYWGHGGNFTKWQVCIPLIVHEPGKAAKKYHHRTTHYDVASTILHNYLGVTNSYSDYSYGTNLNDTRNRGWITVGENLVYAFIAEKDIIIKKEGDGNIDITDANLNPIDNYHINNKAFNAAMKKLNHFYK